jgi:hypothetical protein
MPREYRVTADGDIIAHSLEEAIEIARRLRGGAAAVSGNRMSGATGSATDVRVLRAMEIVASAGKNGMLASDLARELDLRLAQSIGPIIRSIKRIIGGKVPAKDIDLYFRSEREGNNPTMLYADQAKLKEIGLL